MRVVMPGVVAILMGSHSSAIAATNIFITVNSGFSAYVFNGVGNPTLTLVRGFTYVFQLNASGHPFYIKTVQGTGSGNAYNLGVTGNGTTIGTVTFAVPVSAPSLLFYNCSLHSPMTGSINIVDPPVVSITELTVGPNLVINSTGTDALNISVETRSNLLSSTWSPASILNNSYLGGINTTTVSVPSNSASYFRIKQGLP